MGKVEACEMLLCILASLGWYCVEMLEARDVLWPDLSEKVGMRGRNEPVWPARLVDRSSDDSGWEDCG